MKKNGNLIAQAIVSLMRSTSVENLVGSEVFVCGSKDLGKGRAVRAVLERRDETRSL